MFARLKAGTIGVYNNTYIVELQRVLIQSFLQSDSLYISDLWLCIERSTCCESIEISGLAVMSEKVVSRRHGTSCLLGFERYWNSLHQSCCLAIFVSDSCLGWLAAVHFIQPLKQGWTCDLPRRLLASTICYPLMPSLTRRSTLRVNVYRR